MSPLFVLYDFRVAFKLFTPEDKQEATKQSAILRLLRGGVPSRDH